VAFLFKQSSMASFVLTFVKEGSAHDGFIKRLKQGGLWRSFLNKAQWPPLF